jgi:hypothetical protein
VIPSRNINSKGRRSVLPGNITLGLRKQTVNNDNFLNCKNNYGSTKGMILSCFKLDYSSTGPYVFAIFYIGPHSNINFLWWVKEQYTKNALQLYWLKTFLKIETIETASFSLSLKFGLNVISFFFFASISTSIFGQGKWSEIWTICNEVCYQ